MDSVTIGCRFRSSSFSAISPSLGGICTDIFSQLFSHTGSHETASSACCEKKKKKSKKTLSQWRVALDWVSIEVHHGQSEGRKTSQGGSQ